MSGVSAKIALYKYLSFPSFYFSLLKLKCYMYREHFGDDVPGVCRSAVLSDDAMEDK